MSWWGGIIGSWRRGSAGAEAVEVAPDALIRVEGIPAAVVVGGVGGIGRRVVWREAGSVRRGECYVGLWCPRRRRRPGRGVFIYYRAGRFLSHLHTPLQTPTSTTPNRVAATSTGRCGGVEG